MSFIVENNVYQHVALVFATCFLVPQVYQGYTNKSLVDVSSMSLVAVTLSSGLWAMYMYESDMMHFAIATSFVGINAIVLLCMKVVFYYMRVNEHYKTFGKPVQTQILQECVV